MLNNTIFSRMLLSNRGKYYRFVNNYLKNSNKIAVVTGVKNLQGAIVEASDLRAGAALIIAGLMAEGTTYVRNIHFIKRGYVNIDQKLKKLGADIVLEQY